MTNIFTLKDEEDEVQKLNLDDLYEKKREIDLTRVAVFNKLLGRVHNRIKITSRQNANEQFCTFIVPEVMIGIPKYNQAECIGYIVDKLNDNGFNVRYVHPNCIFISWKHWVPGYVRSEIKKKTGINIDGRGNIIKKKDGTSQSNEDTDPNTLMLKGVNGGVNVEKKKEYNPTATYKPTGIYSDNLLNKISDTLKLNK